MLISLELQNFQKHESLTINFTEGLNIFRGVSESGKSSVLRAISYAFYGARALPLPLDETVTWGKTTKELKVKLTFSIQGVIYSISRASSGATLETNEILVSGQTEVTGYVEKLLGVTASMARLLMMPPQGGMKGSLESSAVELIEQLSDMTVLDKLVESLCEDYITGSTKALEEEVSKAEDSVGEVPVLDTEHLNDEILGITEQIAANLQQEDTKLSELNALDLAKAKAEESDYQKSLVEFQAKLKRKAALEGVLTYRVSTCKDTSALEATVSDRQKYLEALPDWNLFTKIKPTSKTYTSESSLLQEITRHENMIQGYKQQQSALDKRIAFLKGTLVSEGTCGVCKKDLSSIPEVLEANTASKKEITNSEFNLGLVISTARAVGELERTLGEDLMIGRKIMQPAKLISLTGEGWPLKAEWIGPDMSIVPVDKTQELRKVQAENLANAKAEADIAGAKEELASLAREIVEPTLPSSSRQVIETYKVLKGELEALKVMSQKLDADLQTWKHSLEMKKLMFNNEVEKYKAQIEKVSELKLKLESYKFNNNLLKKLRAARPVLAARLWETVLSAVSHYFSTIRETTSSVTRSTAGFFVDGHPLESQSVSTKDALGLSVRLALQKTFLGSLDFTVLDEPASGMSPNRELAMLGMLCASGHSQVLLVTHSELADSFAANLIQL